MNEGLIPRRYAKALFKVDTERNSANRSYELMKQLCDAFNANGQLADVVNNPFVDNTDKLALLSSAAGAQARDNTFADFLQLLVENRRVGIILPIAMAYIDIFRKANNVRCVEVVAAAQPDAPTLDRIKAVIDNCIGDASMEFSIRIDPSIIGGFIINIDNECLDASIRNRFKEMRLTLLN